MKIAVMAGFDPDTVYGKAAVLAAIHIARIGVDVRVLALGISAPLPREFTRLLEDRPRGHADAVLGVGPGTMPCVPGSPGMLWSQDEKSLGWPVLVPWRVLSPGVAREDPDVAATERSWPQVAEQLMMRLSRSL